MGTFKPSYPGIGEVLTSGEMQAHMHSLAQKVASAAEAGSPVGGEGDRHPGQYAASWEVESGVQSHTTRRAYGRVTNSVDYAASVEFGNGHMDGQYVLTRAIDAAGA